MKIRIDFSLFASPTDAYGNVTGLLELPNTPQIGDRITLAGHEFRVEHVNHFDFEFAGLKGGDAKGISIGLDDLVLTSRGEAKEFASRLERETGLMCDEYE